jgi:pimeloyl-ACP methyl ester carboxylesterase
MEKFLLSAIMITLASCNSSVSQTAFVNDVSLDYVIRGDGPPLYLLHGGMESRDSFDQQIHELSKTFTIVALDSREQGRSSRADTQISYALMSKDVVALAKHLGHDRISIMGLSDGGVTALTTAMNNPNFVDKLVLLGANYHFESYPEATRSFIANYKWDGNTNPNGYPGNFIEHYLTGQDDLTEFGDLLEEMSIMWTTSPTFTTSDLGTVQAQTLIINGDHEDMGLDHALSLYNALPKAQLFIVPDGTHYALAEKPELINSVTLEFLNQ